MNNTVGLTENFNTELKEVECGSYAKTGPIFLFHIFKKSQKRFHFSQVTKKKNEINVSVLTVCFNDSRNTGKLSIKAVHWVWVGMCGCQGGKWDQIAKYRVSLFLSRAKTASPVFSWHSDLCQFINLPWRPMCPELLSVFPCWFPSGSIILSKSGCLGTELNCGSGFHFYTPSNSVSSGLPVATCSVFQIFPVCWCSRAGPVAP